VASYIVRRLVWAFAVLVAVGVLTFLLAYVAPIDPARAVAGIHAPAETVELIRHALGLDQPLPVQFASYIVRVLQGDFGHSYQQDRDVLPLVLERFPATLQLAVAGIGLELLIGLPLGVAAATHRGRPFDRLATITTSILVAAPAFWVGYVLLDLVAFQPQVHFGVSLFPIGGYEPLSPRHLTLPALTLGLTGAAYYSRLARAMMSEELHQDYIRTARAKGVPGRAVAWRHALRNALPPILTQLGLDLGIFLGGVVVVEQVFSWPGIGKLAVESVVTADIPLLMGTVLFATLCIVLANLVIDLAYAFVDPRISY
jgi:peptide/nickel transport system permease protein